MLRCQTQKQSVKVIRIFVWRPQLEKFTRALLPIGHWGSTGGKGREGVSLSTEHRGEGDRGRGRARTRDEAASTTWWVSPQAMVHIPPIDIDGPCPTTLSMLWVVRNGMDDTKTIAEQTHDSMSCPVRIEREAPPPPPWIEAAQAAGIVPDRPILRRGP